MTEPINETELRLQNHSKRLVILEEAREKTEKRVGDLESDRETIHNLVTTIGLLAAKVQELAAGVDTIAERAVAKVLQERNNIRRQTWKHTIGLVSVGATAATAVVALFDKFIH